MGEPNKRGAKKNVYEKKHPMKISGKWKHTNSSDVLRDQATEQWENLTKRDWKYDITWKKAYE